MSILRKMGLILLIAAHLGGLTATNSLANCSENVAPGDETPESFASNITSEIEVKKVSEWMEKRRKELGLSYEDLYFQIRDFAGKGDVSTNMLWRLGHGRVKVLRVSLVSWLEVALKDRAPIDISKYAEDRIFHRDGLTDRELASRVGIWLRNCRSEAGFTYEELISRLRTISGKPVSLNMVWRLENVRAQFVRVNLLHWLETAFNKQFPIPE